MINNEVENEVNLGSLYITAKKYDEAAEKLGHYFLVQYNVLKTLACEIYLKFIIAYNDNEIMFGHNLKILSEAANIYYLFEKELMTNYNYSKNDVVTSFNNISIVFEKLRYVYENNMNHVNTGFLDLLTVFLRDYCSKLFKQSQNIKIIVNN